MSSFVCVLQLGLAVWSVWPQNLTPPSSAVSESSYLETQPQGREGWLGAGIIGMCCCAYLLETFLLHLSIHLWLVEYMCHGARVAI